MGEVLSSWTNSYTELMDDTKFCAISSKNVGKEVIEVRLGFLIKKSNDSVNKTVLYSLSVLGSITA